MSQSLKQQTRPASQSGPSELSVRAEVAKRAPSIRQFQTLIGERDECYRVNGQLRSQIAELAAALRQLEDSCAQQAFVATTPAADGLRNARAKARAALAKLDGAK